MSLLAVALHSCSDSRSGPICHETVTTIVPSSFFGASSVTCPYGTRAYVDQIDKSWNGATVVRCSCSMRDGGQ